MGHVDRLRPLPRLALKVESRHLLDVAQEVAQQVYHVNGVLHEGAAAQLVAARPIANVTAAIEQLQLGVTWCLVRQQLPGELRRRIVAAHEAHLRNHARLLYGTGEFRRLPDVEALRLFHEDVDACRHCRGNLVGVQGRREANVDRIELFARQHVVMVSVHRRPPERVRLFSCGLLVDIAERLQHHLPRLRQRLQSRQVRPDGDITQTDKSESNGFHLLPPPPVSGRMDHLQISDV